MAINRGGPGVTRRRVVILYRKGMTAPRIAHKLRISRAAVYAHLANARASGELTEATDREGAA
jgi:transposase